ncbi:hypothetical protein CMI37_11465 [Candidatus Pacearchaeota archaeon]|nr:hypothetical protein [Candidatus Pacearchaeota archaeon]|tara:strand:- start:7495 stop:8049 length:555 start_codon:yes stop_codon:yes gene_type:complete
MVEKIALTGAPGSGKTSVLQELECIYEERTIPEAAEDIIKYLQAKGNPKPWELPDFQDRILRLQLQREEQAEQLEGRAFIDRGILDGMAYYQLHGKTLSEAMQEAVKQAEGRYEKVFLIEIRDNCQKTGIRRENLKEARVLEKLQHKNYTDAGYNVEIIPLIRIEDRAKRILRSLQELKGGEEK